MKLGFRTTAVLIVCGVFLIFFEGKGVITAFMPAQMLYAEDCDWTKLKNGQRVYADVDFVFSPLGVYTDKNDNETSAIYAFPDIKFEEDGSSHIDHYLGISVPSSSFDVYDAIVDASVDWWNDTTGEVEWAGAGIDSYDGYLRKMKKNEIKQSQKTLRGWGYTDAQIDEMLFPYVMVRSQSFMTNVFFVIGGMVFSAIGAVLGIVSYLKK